VFIPIARFSAVGSEYPLHFLAQLHCLAQLARNTPCTFHL
jgi:hypothetical protein